MTGMAAAQMQHTVECGHTVTDARVDRAQMDWTHSLLQEKMQQPTVKVIVLHNKDN